MSRSVSSRKVNAALRALVWPELRERGFNERTQRTAWSDRADCVAVVNFQSFNSHLAERIGATTFSFGVNLGVRALSSTRWRDQLKVKNGRLRPHEYECDVRRALWKTIDQPELARRHIWYVRADGNNVTAAVEDARAVLLSTGMSWLEEFSNPERLLAFAENEPEEWDSGTPVGSWGLGVIGSPFRQSLVNDLRRSLQQ
jgi:hypothetical protein